MGFVDTFDQLKSYMRLTERAINGGIGFFSTFSMSQSSTHTFYTTCCTGIKIHFIIIWKKFRLDLVSALVSKSHQVIERSSAIPTPHAKPVKLKFRKDKVSEKDRLKNVGHILQKCKSRRCAYCSTTSKPHRTSYMCPTCDVSLCMVIKGASNATCFEKFHAEWK